ncbi:MAG: hypothetical protein OHK0039_14670 [Bacteroidia bacterium]
MFVGEIGIEGNDKTRAWVILREMTFAPGDSIERDRLDAELERSRTSVYNLGLFTSVIFEPTVQADVLLLRIVVQERWYLWGSPEVDVEERNAYDVLEALRRRELRRLVYGADLTWRNVSGRNETLLLTGQAGFSQRLRIDLLRPALWRRYNTDLRVGVALAREKEVIIGTAQGRVVWQGLAGGDLQRSISTYVGAARRFDPFRTLYAELSWRQVVVSDSLYLFDLDGAAPPYLPRMATRLAYPGLLLSYAVDRRDIRSFPLSGSKYQLLLRCGVVPGGSFVKGGATWAHHLPMGRRWNLAYGAHLIATLGDSLPFVEKSVIGIDRADFQGISTELRGYEPYVITGTWVSMVKTEWKYAIFPRRIVHLSRIPYRRFRELPAGVYLGAYGDAAYVADRSFSNQDTTFTGRWLLGYGVGLNLTGWYDLLMRIEYSRNLRGEGAIYLHATVPIK